MASDFLADLLVRVGMDMSDFQAGAARVADRADELQRELEGRVAVRIPPPAPPQPIAPTIAVAAQAQAAVAAAAIDRQGDRIRAAHADAVAEFDRTQSQMDALAKEHGELQTAINEAVQRKLSYQTIVGSQARIEAIEKEQKAAISARDQALATVTRIQNQAQIHDENLADRAKGLAAAAEDAEKRRAAASAARATEQLATREQRFGLGALRAGLREAGPALGVPVPFFGGPAFVAGAIAVGALGAAAKAAVTSVSALASNMSALTRASGGTVEELARAAAETRRYGIDNDTLVAALANTRQAAISANPALAALGVEATTSTGGLRPTTQILAEARDAISQITDPTLQAAVAERIFGDAARDLLPYLRAQHTELEGNADATDRAARSLEEATLKAKEIAIAANEAKTAWRQFTDDLGQRAAQWVSYFVELRTANEAGRKAFDETIQRGGSTAEATAAEALAATEAVNALRAKAAQGLEQPAEVPSPPAGIAQLQKLAADAGLFQTASRAAFTEASRGADQFDSSLTRAGATLSALGVDAQTLPASIRGIAGEFNQLLAAGVLRPQTEQILSIALKLNLDPAEMERVFRIAEGIAGDGAESIAQTINNRLGAALGDALEQQLVSQLERVEEQATSLEDRLAGIAESRADRAERASDREIDAAEARADRLQRLADEETEHQERIAEARDDATRALGEFQKAELDAQLRAREEEKAFFAFRPDTANRAEQDEARYQRQRARELAAEARTEAREARQTARQAEQDARAAAREDREETRIRAQLAAIEAAHPDIEAELQVARDDLATAKDIVNKHVEVLNAAESRQRTEAEQERARADRIEKQAETRSYGEVHFAMTVHLTSDGTLNAADLPGLAALITEGARGVLVTEARGALNIVRGGSSSGPNLR